MFSDPLPGGGTDLSGYVVVDGAPNVAVETEDTQLCITGVEHGKRYHVKVRAGLPSADKETLRSDVELDVYVPDRSPFVGFANNAYVLPAGLGGGLPITSVNAKTADVVIYRIGDRVDCRGRAQRRVQGHADRLFGRGRRQPVWREGLGGQGRSRRRARSNALVTTAIPISDVLPKIQPGAYVITAKVEGVQAGLLESTSRRSGSSSPILGLTTVSGDDGIHGFVRSLTTAQPVAGAKVRLVAVNNEILGETTTDANGEVTFAPGLARGDGGRAPQLLVAQTERGRLRLPRCQQDRRSI